MRLFRHLIFLTLLFPAFLHGSEELVTVADGSTIKVFVFYPKNFGEGPWPLTVLMSGGTANEYVVRAQFWLGHELANQGWAIAVPVSPNDDGFFGASGERIPEVIASLQSSNSIQPGKTLLVGVSNGGSSALELASQHPDNYFGVVAVPGIIKDETKIGNFDGLPVYVRIGENDFLRWNKELPTLIRQLTDAGAKVNAKLEPNANHVFPINWSELQPWLDSIREDSLPSDKSATLP